jgi:hypothetical protein
MIETMLVRLLNAVTRRPVRRAQESGLLIGTGAEPPHPVVIPHARRFEHAVIVGKTGSGKTHALETLAYQIFERNDGMCFFDYHGDAIEHLVKLASQFPQAAERLVIFDPTDPAFSPGLNALEIDPGQEHQAFSRTDEITTILKERWGRDAIGARTEELLRNVSYTLATTGYTLVDAAAFLTSNQFHERLIAQLRNPEVASYWRERYSPLSEAMKAVFREPLLNKISGFTTDPISRHLLGQQRSTLHFSRAMAEGQWVLINLSKGLLREHAHTLGNLIFAKLQFDVMARASLPETNRPIFTIFCDEVQNLAENDLVVLLTEGRKYGISIFSSGQYWEQVPTYLRGALLAAGSHMFFRVSAHDATTLAAELSADGKRRYHAQLTTLERGQAIVRIGSAPPELVAVPPLSRRRSVIPVHELRAIAQRRFARDRVEVEREIRSRRNAVAVDVTHSNDDQHHHNQQPHGQVSW